MEQANKANKLLITYNYWNCTLSRAAWK